MDQDIPKYEDTLPNISDDEKSAVADYILEPLKSSPGEAALLGAQSGLTFGTEDELSGIMGAGLETAAGISQGELTPVDKMKSLYEEYRNAARARSKAAQEEFPGYYTAGAVGGGFLTPMPQALRLGPTATLGEKMLKGAAVGAGAGTLAGAGVSEAPIGTETLEDMTTGAKYGTILGGGIPAAQSLAGATYKGGKALASPFVKGFRHGLKGVDLIGEEAEKGVQQTISAHAENMSQQLTKEMKNLAIQKNKLLQEASDAGVRIEENDLNQFLNESLGADVETNLPEVSREIEKFREVIRTAKEGPEIERIRRVFYGDSPTKMEQFRQQAQAKEAVKQFNEVTPSPTKEVEEFEQLAKVKQQEQELVPGSSDLGQVEVEYQPTGRPNEVLGVIKQRIVKEGETPGYRKVASKLIDEKDADAMDRLEKLVEMKRAEQQAVPGANPAEIEVVFEPTTIPVEGADDARTMKMAVLRQKEMDVPQTEQYKKIASKVLNVGDAPAAQPYEAHFIPTDDPNTVIGVIRQPVVDKFGRVISYKTISQKLLPKEEAAKFKDITETVRAGGRDLSDPKQLYQLYKDLKQRSQYGDYSFKSDEALKATSTAMQKSRDLIRSKIPGIAETDAKLAALNKAAELLHLGDTKAPDIVDEQQMMERMMDFINRQEVVGTTGGKARKRLETVVDIIRPHYPEMAETFKKMIPELGEQAMTAKATSGIVQPGIVSTPKRWAAVGGNAIGQAINKISNLPPEALKAKANLVLVRVPSAAGKQLAEVLNKMADKTVGERNALLFGLMQNPAYRQMLLQDENIDQEQAK